jgi:hypothetical protein
MADTPATPSPPAPSPTPAEKQDQITQQAIAIAKDLPSLVGALRAADSPLADQIEGKAAINSRTLWGTLLVAVISAAAAKAGFAWDDQTVAIVALVVGLAVQTLWGIVARFITVGPIKGLISKGSN